MLIKKMSQKENENNPPGLGIIILGVTCIIIGLYFAFFYTGISYLTFNLTQTSPYDLFGNFLIFAGIIILLIGSYRQKNSPTY
jgi:uncharacterized membrane protein